MNQRLKQELSNLYEPPRPQKKEEFIRSLGEQELSFWDFFKMQLGYIRKWNWLFAVGLFFLAFILTKLVTGIEEKRALCAISALIPFLALSTVAETSRSVRYGMEELELSARFSLKTVFLIRLCILGIGNLLLLLFLFPVAGLRGELEILERAVYILMPYLLTASLDLMLVRKIRQKEGMYACFGVTVLVSGLYLLDASTEYPVWMLMKPKNWVAVMVFLMILTGRECMKMTKQSEEYVWNLY